MSNIDPVSRDLLIRTVYGEAGNQSPDGQSAVANVVLNRLRSGKYGPNVRDVVFAPNQFEPWGTRRDELMALKNDHPAYLAAASAVDGVLGGQVQDNTNGATHFLNPEIVRQRRGGNLPAWASNEPTATIGAHSFYSPSNQRTKMQTAENNAGALPPGFTLDKPGNSLQQQALPAGFVLDKPKNSFDSVWANADGTEPSRGVPLRTMKESPLDPEIDRILDREAQNPDPTVARQARVERHVRDPIESQVRNSIYNNPITGALAMIFPKEKVIQGVMYGFGEEMLAKIKEVAGKGVYDEVLEANRERLQRIHNENPTLAVAGEIAGNLVTAPATAPLKLFQGASLLPRVANTTVSSAGLSGLYGFGTGEGAEDRTQRGLEGTLWGALLGLGGEAAISTVGAGLRKVFGGANTAASGVNMPQRVADASELNIPLSRAQATGDLKQQAWEQAARNNAKGQYAGNTMRAFDDQQTAAIRGATDNIQSNFGPAATAEIAGAQVQQAVQNRASLLKVDAENAYSAAANKNAWIAADEVSNLAKRVTDELETAGIRLDQYGNYPGSQNAINLLRRVAGFDGAPEGEVVAQSLQGLEQVRKGLLKIRPGNGEDARALTAIKGQFDNWISDAIDKKLFTGDATALNDLRNARNLWSQYKGMTAATDGPMKVISRMASEERTGSEVANWLISSNTVGKAGDSARVASRIKQMVGASSDEWQSLRAATWDRIVNDATGAPRNAQQIAAAINDLARGNGKPLAGVLYSPQEIGQMIKLANVIRYTATDARAFNPSRTGYELVRALADKAGLAITAGAGGATWLTGDPRYLAALSVPLVRGAAGVTRANAATRALPSATGATLGEVFRLPQRALPVLLSGQGR